MGEKKKEVNPLKTTKRWLYELNQYRQAVYSLREMLQCVDGLEGIRYNGMPSSGKIGDPTLELVSRREELVLRLRNTERIVKMVDSAINELTPFEKKLVCKKYITGLSWTSISKEVNYCREWCVKKGSHALKKVSRSLFGS